MNVVISGSLSLYVDVVGPPYLFCGGCYYLPTSLYWMAALTVGGVRGV